MSVSLAQPTESKHNNIHFAKPSDSPAPVLEQSAVAQIDVQALAQRCMIENERFYRDQSCDARFAYELFRRALVEEDNRAWSELIRIYRPTVERWVTRKSTLTSYHEGHDDLVMTTFIRFWQSITPTRFALFPSTAALLQYLRCCANCVVIDNHRVHGRIKTVPSDTLVERHLPHVSPDEEAMNRINRAEFWRSVNEQLRDESERIVVHHSYVYGMKPKDIHQSRPDLFDNVQDVYVVKRNVLDRLSRNRDLLRLLV
ncbi:MAG: sigma-70 family RNA polymerase sigma factor [Chloroflexota bacterium]